jgi:hypothetical protein
MSVVLPGERSLDLAIRPGPDEADVEITVLESLGRRVFECCPICGGPASTEEHVPPRRLGGMKMTRTCQPCNGRLGSLVEPDLIDWLEDAITRPFLHSPQVQGRGSLGRVLFRTTPDGIPVFLVDGSHPEVDGMLQSDGLELEDARADRNRYSIALLKHGYLACCLMYGIPEGDATDMVRRDLIRARDAKDREQVPRSDVAFGLTIAGGYGDTPVSDPLVRAVLHDDDGDVEGVLLSGRVFVSWSSRLDPNRSIDAPRPVRTPLQVGSPSSGEVTAVRP